MSEQQQRPSEPPDVTSAAGHAPPSAPRVVLDTVDFEPPKGDPLFGAWADAAPPAAGRGMFLQWFDTTDFQAPTQDRPPTPDSTQAGEALPPVVDEAAGQAAHTLPESSEPLPQVEGYEILRRLGHGGMGVVYLARHAALQRVVALKMIRRDARSGELAYRQEALSLAQLQHPNIVQIHDVVETDGAFFLVLEYCGGGSLAAQLDGTLWPSADAARLISTLARAAHAAHERGIIHGDLKPQNILLTDDGIPKISDFGVGAMLRLHGEGISLTGRVIGTPAFMSPEQAAGRHAQVGPAADIYSLGAILYLLLTGRPPFQGATPYDTVWRVVRDEPAPPRELQPQAPRELEAVCLNCLEKDPQKRYSSALELAEGLERFLTEESAPGGAHAPSLPSDALPGHLRQRVAAARALRGRDRLVETLLANVHDGVMVLDRAGAVVRANAAAEKLLGGALIGLTVAAWTARDSFFKPDDRSPCPAEDLPPARALRGEPAAEVELYVRAAARPEGAWVGVSAHPLPGEDGEPNGAIVVVRDIPGRQQAEYRSLVESLQLSVFRKDLDGRYTFANDRFCRTLGLERGAVLGRTDSDLFTPEMAEKYRDDDRHVLGHLAWGVAEKIEEHRRAACGPRCRCGGTPADEVETNLVAGQTRWLQVLLGPVYDVAGRPAGTQGAFWDVTPRLQAERRLDEVVSELRTANAQLARSNADLEQFAFAASHDLQEPLRMVATYTQLLQRRYLGRLDADADEFIAFAVEGATHMHDLINALLEYSRVTTRGARMAETPARAAFDQAVRNLESALRDKDAQVTCGLLPSVWADATQLTQVFQNLIHNGVKFCQGRRPIVHVSARPHGREWVLAVRDNGIGIETRHLERIFDIFQRLHTREQYEGTGVGLALCKKIVERHGGRIWAESEPGLGSVFSFTLLGGSDPSD